MRARLGIITAVLLVGLLGACSDDDPEAEPGDGPTTVSSSDIGSPTGKPTDDPSVSEITVDCPKFEKLAREIADAQAALYDPAGDPEQAIADLQAGLEELKEGAPEDIQQALTDLGSGFQDAAELLADPTQTNQARLVALAAELAADGQRVTTYVTEQCG